MRRWRPGKTVLVAVIALLAGILSGCRWPWSAPELDHAEVIQQMYDYLQAKYDRTFQLYASSWPDKMGLTSRIVNFLVYPTGGVPQDYFRVELDTSGKGLAFHDGYVGNLMRPVYEAKTQAVLSRYLPGSLVVVTSPGATEVFPDDLDANSTFDQFRAYADQNCQILFATYVRMSEGMDKEAVSATLPLLKDEFSAMAPYGYIGLSAYSATDFDAQVEPALKDPVRRFQGMPAGGYVQFYLTSSWRV